MCIAVPAKVIDISEGFGNVEALGVRTRVNIQLIENIKEGEHVLIHTGFAIEKIDEEHFETLTTTLKEMIDRDDLYG